jgi:ADP-ribose pyrophosphatase
MSGTAPDASVLPAEHRVTRTRVERPNPYFELVTRWVEAPGDADAKPYYTVRPAHYVNVLAVTESDEIVLAREYRPTVEGRVLGLPGGTLEPDESPEACIRRELWEETGYVAGELVPLGTLLTDHGRLENRLFAFFAPGVRREDPAFTGESDVETVLLGRAEFFEAVRDGRFAASMQIGIVALAGLRGLIDWPVPRVAS